MQFSIIFLLASPALLWAQVPDSASKKIYEYPAIRITNPIKLDGILSESDWLKPAVSGFTQKDPKEGQPATESTKVWFGYDDEAFYIAARLYSSDPKGIRALVSRRDQTGNSERIIVSLDTYLDRRTAYTFVVTASGTRADYYHSSDNEYDRDYTFDPVWEAKTHVDSLGWTAEMRIPLSQLRFNAKEEQTWGFNIDRWIPTKNEDDYFVYIPKKETGWASRFAHITGIKGIRPSRRLELAPYCASDATFTYGRDKHNPFDNGVNWKGRGGADLKMGLGPNLTLDAAVNPDFGQVEADPAVVNLSAYEVFFDEKRPFFIEGSQLLRGNGPSYFYSRRIGAAPKGDASGDFVDYPKTCTILGAAKLTGRLASGLSIGALTAVTHREYARVYDTAAGYSKTKVAPLTGFGVLRLQQEFGPSASTAGFTLTAVRRDLHPMDSLARLGNPVDTLAKELNRQAYTGGGDWNLRFEGGKYVFGGNLGFSYIQGDSNAIYNVQTSSRHYFQRPDATYLKLDPSRTSLFGYTGGLFLNKNGGKHWLWNFGCSAESPGLEMNDAGRMGKADKIEPYGNLRYRETTPGKLFRDYDIHLNVSNGWDFGGIRQYSVASLEWNFTWKNFWHSFVGTDAAPRAQSDDITRGGPLMEKPAAWEVWSGISSNQASNFGWNTFTYYGKDEIGSWAYTLEGGLSFRSKGRWEASVFPHYNRTVNNPQYISFFPGGRSATYNGRYVFSKIETSTLSAQLRVNYAFTPDLTLEVYAEPFASSGRYYDLGELSTAKSWKLRSYGTDGTTIVRNSDGSYSVTDTNGTFTISNPDFNVLSFRSNVVLRWEWLRGSTMYFVWARNLSKTESEGWLIHPTRLWDAFTTGGDVFVAFKVSYWIPVS